MENSRPFGVAQEGDRRLLPPTFCGDSGASRQLLRACSACAGDYEDPDQTSWTPDREEDEELPQKRAHERAEDQDEDGDEFPATEE
ncbi:MAG: hypothetical protein ACHQIK_10385 [Candidatus Acidiferrales bacterium]